jgi:uncharacterized protein (TIGR00297 family)
VTLRTGLGFFIALVIALVARRTRSLSTSGAAAAIVVGTIAVSAGWSWGALLILYFAGSTALSHLGRREKERRTESIVAKGGERDATQVLANGLVFAIAALMRWPALGAGALAASAADTWATEIGTLYGGQPRSILTLRRVPAGTSGGVSWIGTLASIAGACFIAIVAVILRLSAATAKDLSDWTGVLRFAQDDGAVAIIIGGVAGAFVDTLLGATLQTRRWCAACRTETEREIHSCGAATEIRRGLGWLDNDVVNFVATCAGGLLAAALAR